MKRILQSISFLIIGALIISSCSDEKTGKSSEKITEEIELDLEEVMSDSIPSDLVLPEDTLVPLPSPSPSPAPWPIPPLDPKPIPWPPGPEPYPIPEPEPEPIPVQVDPVLEITEIEPAYPGGAAELMKFISENIEYPEMAREMNEQGRVYVQFIVERDGSLTKVEVIRGVTESLDREAIRVMRLMPKWTPGESDGKIVRVRMRLPIQFRLD